MTISTLEVAAFEFEYVGDERGFAFGRARAQLISGVKTGVSLARIVRHRHQPTKKTQRSRKATQICLRLTVLGARLIFEYADRNRRLAGQLEGMPNFLAVEVFADGPGDFAGSFVFFAGQQERRLDVVHDDDGIADANLPREFAEHIARGGFGGLEVAEVFAEIVGAIDEVVFDGGFDFADGDVVPVALVFAEVAETFIGIEKQVFVPVVAVAVDENRCGAGSR